MTGFTRSLRALGSDRFLANAAGIAAAAAVLFAWGYWLVQTPLPLYEITSNARLEVDQAIYPVQAPMLGRVQRTTLAVGKVVEEGEVLVELDTSAERLQVAEEEARLRSIEPDIEALRRQIDSEQRARIAEQQSTRVAVEQARVQARQAQAPAQFNAGEEARLKELRRQGLIAEREYDRGKADAEQTQFAAESVQMTVARLEQEQRARDGERDTRIRKLEADITHLESQIATSRATIVRLKNEIEKRTVRAPVAGRLGEAAILRIGAVLQDGEKVGAIVPGGQLLAVAQFPPPAAFGRIAPGQPAELRLDGFPWAQWGSIPAVVRRVAGEVRDGTVRVELALAPNPSSRIPIQHGLPGSVEVQVERATPATLLMRVAGRMISAPRSPYEAGQ